MKKFTLLFLFVLSLVIACGDDDDPTGPSGPSKDGAVLISGGGSSTEFDTFEFVIVPFFDWLIISSVKGTDSLLINLFDYQSIGLNTAISITDTNLFIIGSFGSGEFGASNFQVGVSLSGSITFTSLDTSGSIAANFSSDATLTTFNNDTELISTGTIAGDFVATKAAGAAAAASIYRREEIRQIF